MKPTEVANQPETAASAVTAAAASREQQDALAAALLASGALAHVPSSRMSSAEFRAWHPLEVAGLPVSETLIEERR